MNGDEILGVLREIRDEAKQTNARLDQTNARLTSLEGRVDFLERRVSKGFSEMSESLNALARAQADGELRLATEVVSLANVTRELRDVIAEKLTNHEKRLKTLEKHNGPRKR